MESEMSIEYQVMTQNNIERFSSALSQEEIGYWIEVYNHEDDLVIEKKERYE